MIHAKASCPAGLPQVTLGAMANNPVAPLTDALSVLLMTRPRPASEAFAAGLRVAGGGFDLVISPLIRVVPLGHLPDMERFSGLVFTSAQGVARYVALNGPRRMGYAVGGATAQAARAAGLHVTSADGDADALVALIRAHPPTGPLLHVRGQHSRGQVVDKLRQAGIATQDVVVYDQVLEPLSDAAKDALRNRRVVCPVFSPRSAAHLADQATDARDLNIVAMSPAVAAELPDLKTGKMVVSPRPQAQAMQRATLDLLVASDAG